MISTKNRLSFVVLAGEIIITLRRSIASLITWEILFKLISLALFVPLITACIAAFVASTHSVTITNYQLIGFFFSLRGILFILVIMALEVTILFAEQGGLILISRYAQQRNLTGIGNIFWRIIFRLPVLIRLAIVEVAVYMIYLLPCAGILGGLYAFLVSRYDINYYITNTPPLFWIALIIAGLTIGVLSILWGRLFVKWSVAVPLCILGKHGARESLKKSSLLTAGYRNDIFVYNLIWIGILVILGLLGKKFLDTIEIWLLNLTGEKTAILIPSVSFLMILNIVVAAILSFLAVTTFSLLAFHIFNKLLKYKEEPFEERLPVHGKKAKYGHFVSVRTFIIVTLLFLFGLILGFSIYLIHRISYKDAVAVTAHRAGAIYAPENTLSALREAIKIGADYAEIDVQETADGVVVVLHDEDLMRVGGVNKKIWDISFHELHTIDVGSWFSPEFRGERVPTLDEMIDAAGDKIKLSIEIKITGHEQTLAQKVVRIIQDKKFISRCAVISLSYNELQKVEHLDNTIQTGLVVFRSLGDVSKVNTDFISISSSLLNQRLLHHIKKNHKQVHVWTINDPKTASYFIDLGVDNIITDDPEMVISLLQERSELLPSERIILSFRHWLTR